MRHRHHIIPIFVWIGLGLVVMALSYRLGLGGLRNPGPGLMPFLLGFFLSVISFYFLVTFRSVNVGRAQEADDTQGRIRVSRLWLVLATLFGSALLLEPLGFLVTTFVMLTILFRVMNNRWATVLLASFVTVLVSYLLFTYLGLRFPKGILKGL